MIPSECRVLKSRERVPFLLIFEVVENNEFSSSTNVHKQKFISEWSKIAALESIDKPNSTPPPSPRGEYDSTGSLPPASPAPPPSPAPVPASSSPSTAVSSYSRLFPSSPFFPLPSFPFPLSPSLLPFPPSFPLCPSLFPSFPVPFPLPLPLLLSSFPFLSPFIISRYHIGG